MREDIILNVFPNGIPIASNNYNTNEGQVAQLARAPRLAGEVGGSQPKADPPRAESPYIIYTQFLGK